MSQGIRILSHARGNLDTEVGRSLPDTDSIPQPVSRAEQKRGELKTWRESDHLIVLGGRESRPHGEGHWQAYIVRKGNIGRTSRIGGPNANLTVGNSREG